MFKPPDMPAVLETALYAPDLDRARAFYGDVLGLSIVVEVPDRHVFFRVAGGMLLIFRPEATAAAKGPVPPHGATGPGHVCFSATEAALETWVALFAARGIEIEADFRWPNGARSIYVRDPAGNSVEFAEPHLWA